MASEQSPLAKAFDLTDHEALFERISHTKLMQLVQAEATTVLELQISSNVYGEFLFVMLMRVLAEQPIAATFFGLGFHEHRERWLTNEWFFYQSGFPQGEREPLARAEVLTQLTRRRDEINDDAQHSTQTKRGQLFELLADLTDEDGALAEMDDLDDLDWFDHN